MVGLLGVLMDLLGLGALACEPMAVEQVWKVPLELGLVFGIA